MYLRTTNLIICIVCLFFCGWTFPALAQMDLDYQVRYNEKGERYMEGINSYPVSYTNNLELIAALVHRYVLIKQMPEELRLGFYLDRPADVYLRVQEFEYRNYYRMDRTILWSESIANEENTFVWPTQPVLKQLEDLNLYKLGAVARLNRLEPSLFEEVAPVVFYRSSLEFTGGEYVFIFRPSDDAKLTCSLYQEEELGKLIFIQNIPVRERQWGGRWFNVRWKGANAEPGYYQLKIRGHFDSNYPINQTVRFYHKK